MPRCSGTARPDQPAGVGRRLWHLPVALFPDAAIDTLLSGFDLGVNLVHTAPDYEGAEDLVAEAVARPRSPGDRRLAGLRRPLQLRRPGPPLRAPLRVRLPPPAIRGPVLRRRDRCVLLCNAHLRMLLDDIINDSRWDMTYLGMQVMVEGLALAAFGFMHQMTEEPLLKKLLRYVMSDEARHVAFGVLSLKEVYDGMSDAEMKDRQEFAFEAAVRIAIDSSQEVWERMGVAPATCCRSCCATRCATSSSRCCSPRSCRTARSLASSIATTCGCATAFRGDGRHPVRGLGGHGRGVHQVRTRPRSRLTTPDPRRPGTWVRIRCGRPIRA